MRVSQGFFSIQQTCPQCHGTGKIIPEPCATCGGAGRIKKHKTLSVKIPEGVDQDDRIRLSGEGEAGLNGGPPGDLYVVVSLKPHPVFQRENSDLHCEMPISFATRRSAVKSRSRRSTVTPRSRSRRKPRAGRCSACATRASRAVRSSVHGDLYCHVAIETPVKLTGRQKELLREFEAIIGEDPARHNPRAKNWLDRVREFFGT